MIMLGEELPSLPPLMVRHWFFIIQIFEQLSCSEKQSCPETFHCAEIFFIFQDFWATCGLPWKTECALNSLYWMYIFLIIQTFEQLAHTVSLKFFTALKYFYLSGFLRNLRLTWKQSLSWNFSLYLIYFLHSGCLSNCCLPWKTECAWIHCIECIFILQNFEQLALALKNRVCPENFHCIEIRIFEELALALKTEFSLKFSLYWT